MTTTLLTTTGRPATHSAHAEPRRRSGRSAAARRRMLCPGERPLDRAAAPGGGQPSETPVLEDDRLLTCGDIGIAGTRTDLHAQTKPVPDYDEKGGGVMVLLCSDNRSAPTQFIYRPAPGRRSPPPAAAAPLDYGTGAAIATVFDPCVNGVM